MLRSFQITLFITKMPSLIRKEKVSCEHCGTQVTRNNIVRHKRRCSAGTLYCTQRPNFSTLSQVDLNYHIAKKQSFPRPSITYKCKLCHAEFSSFYVLRQHKNTQHGTQIGFGASNFDVEDIVGMLTIKIWEKNWNLANTLWQILNWRMKDTESSTLPCHPLTLLCSTINWIMYSKNSNVLQNLTLHLVSFWKILTIECVDTFTLTRTTLLWKELNLSVHTLIWPTWKTECRKWILLIFVHEREPIRSGNFTNLQI